MLSKIENYIVPILLVVVAFFQIYNSQVDCLDPWKGAGFGMFSTNEENLLNAVGYLSNGDSILIAVRGNKHNVPISNSLVKTAHRYPKDKILKRIGKQMLKSHYKPDDFAIKPTDIDRASYNYIKGNHDFYTRVYIPTFYQNEEKIKQDSAVTIEKVKIMIFKSNFYDEGYTIRKEYLKEVVI